MSDEPLYCPFCGAEDYGCACPYPWRDDDREIRFCEECHRMPIQDFHAIVATAIARLGVPEVSRRLGTNAQTTLRLAVVGARVRRGSIALVEANLHKLNELILGDGAAAPLPCDACEARASEARASEALNARVLMLRKRHDSHAAPDFPECPFCRGDIT